MKKTLLTVLAFALVFALLFGVSCLFERVQTDSEKQLDEQKEAIGDLWDSEMDAGTATNITMNGDSVSIRGEGAAYSGGIVTVAAAGTYRLSGSLDGSVIVDCENGGNVYLLLDGVSVSGQSGPAIYVKNASETCLWLTEGSNNRLSDSAAYAPVLGIDGQPEAKQPDAVIYSADDLIIAGSGCLEVCGSYENAVHSRDKLEISGGVLDIYSGADGIKTSDGLTVSGGELVMLCGDDCLSASKGNVDIDGGSLRLTCSGDAITAAEKIKISDGEIIITTCREGLEAPEIKLTGGNVTVTAESNAFAASMGDVDSGVRAEDCSVVLDGGNVYALAPCCVSSDGSFALRDGTAFLRSSDPEVCPVKAAAAGVYGGSLFMCGSFTADVFAENRVNAVFYNSSTLVTSGTMVSLSDAEGEMVYGLTPNADFYSLYIAYDGLRQGKTYTLACGTASMSFTPENAVTTAAPVSSQRSGFGFPGRP